MNILATDINPLIIYEPLVKSCANTDLLFTNIQCVTARSLDKLNL